MPELDQNSPEVRMKLAGMIHDLQWEVKVGCLVAIAQNSEDWTDFLGDGEAGLLKWTSSFEEKGVSRAKVFHEAYWSRQGNEINFSLISVSRNITSHPKPVSATVDVTIVICPTYE